MIKLIILLALGKKIGSRSLIVKMIKSYILVYMVVFPIVNFAQTFEWIKYYPVDLTYNPDFLNYSVSVDNNSNVIFGGIFTFHENAGAAAYGDLAIRKHDANGNSLYTFYAYGAGNVVNMKHDQNNNLVLILSIREDLLLDTSDTLFHSGSTASLHILKLDENFDFVWSKMIDDDFNYSFPKGFTIDEDNNIYYGHNNFQNSELIVLNPDGIEISSIVQQNVGVISSVDIDNDGNIYTAGSCASSGAIFGGVAFEPPFSYNTYIAKYNNLTEIQWVNYVEDVTCPFPEVVVNDPDHIYFTGELYLSVMFGTIPVNGPDWVFDFFVAKLNANGDFIWVNEVPDMDSIAGDASVGKFNSCTLDSDNNITVTGFIRGNIDWGNGMVATSTNIGYDLLVVRYNEVGDILMSKTGGGESFDKAISSAIGPDDDLYIAGYGTDTTVFDTLVTYFEGYYPYLLKLDIGNTVTGLKEHYYADYFSIYPNPAKDEINIKSIYTEYVEFISLQDINGVRLEIKESSGDKELKLDMSKYSSGIYFLIIRMNDQSYHREKIIKL